MPAALYYPHTHFADDALLRTSLLLWDRVDVIVPHGEYSLTEGYSGVDAEARGLLLRPRVPDFEEKARVHDRVDALLEDGVPPWLHRRFALHERSLRPKSQPSKAAYLVHHEKLASETWYRLQQSGLFPWDRSLGRAAVPPALGYLLMAMLAEACAGHTLHKITDRAEAYSDLFSMSAQSLGGSMIFGNDALEISSAVDRLVSVSVRVANLTHTPLKTLVALRNRELKEPYIRSLRGQYVELITEQMAIHIRPGLTDADRKEITNEFARTAESKLADLKSELRIARAELLLTESALAIAVAAAGVLMGGPLTAAASVVKTIGAAALVTTANKYAQARRDALTASAMSWLFLARPRFGDLMRVKV